MGLRDRLAQTRDGDKRAVAIELRPRVVPVIEFVSLV